MNPLSLGLMEIEGRLGVPLFTLVLIFVFLLLWSIFWKGWALWVSARKTQKVWFVVFLLVNTLGILEIVYLFLLNKNDTVGVISPETNQS